MAKIELYDNDGHYYYGKLKDGGKMTSTIHKITIGTGN